jgi:aminopeptidase-like protein
MISNREPSASDQERVLLDRLFDRLWPLLRSITGPGIEQSLAIVGEHIPLTVEKVPSGTQVFDWIVPDEWHCRSARLTGPDGAVVCDLATSNLHVLNYSAPVDQELTLAELQPHLHSLPALPDAVPYVTSYYNRTWGFCLSDNVRRALPDGRYRARIDSNFVKGGVPFAEAVLKGETEQEILLSSYLCHPSVANNELSGPLALVGLYRRISAWPRRRYTYRFVINPETIGSLCYLSRRAEHLRRTMVAGLVLTCVGGSAAALSYKLSRREDSLLDRLVMHRASNTSDPTGTPTVRAFSAISGSDERQYCSPGFNLPVGQIARSIYGEYPGYHNSLDDKAFMGIDTVARSIDEIERLLGDLEIAGRFINLAPFGEPQLGRRGLYPNMNSPATRGHSADEVVDGRVFLERLLTVLSYSDGKRDMIWTADRIGCRVGALRPVIERLETSGLLRLGGQADD